MKDNRGERRGAIHRATSVLALPPREKAKAMRNQNVYIMAWNNFKELTCQNVSVTFISWNGSVPSDAENERSKADRKN